MEIIRWLIYKGKNLSETWVLPQNGMKKNLNQIIFNTLEDSTNKPRDKWRIIEYTYKVYDRQLNNH